MELLPIEREYSLKRARYIRSARLFGVNHPHTLKVEDAMAELEDELIAIGIDPDKID